MNPQSDLKKLTNNPILEKIIDKGIFTHRGKQYPIAHCSSKEVCAYYAKIITDNQLKKALEIGTLFGFSTLFLAEALMKTGGSLTTIDLRLKSRTWYTGDEVIDIHEVAEKFVSDSGYSSIVKFLQGNSNQLLPKLYQEGERFEFALIDGSHVFDVALLDFIFCDCLIEKGGFIALDDIGSNMAAKDKLQGGPNRLLQMIFASNRYRIIPINANVVLCEKLSTMNSQSTATESLDFYNVSSSDILRWDKEWARYLCKYHGNRFFSSLTDRNSQVSKFIKDISKLRADEVYDFKGPVSLINIWCDSDNIVGKKIVEIGCGPGQLGKQLGHLAVHYLGLDYSNLALYLARVVSPISCEYINIGDKSSIAKFRDSRDTVVTRHFYIHQNISNAIWVTRLAYFLLKPGGLLIADFYYPTQEDFDKNSPNLLPAKSNLQEYPSTVFYFSSDEINEIADICGFEIVDEKIDFSGKRKFVQMRKGVNVNAR